MFLKKAGKKLIFSPKIVLRVKLSDPARNHQFCADFLNVRLQCTVVIFYATVELLTRYLGEAGGSAH
jgi:hypothetical protein